MFINEKSKTIEMSASEYKEAMTYGTEEYKALREIRNDHPGFKAVEVKAKKSKNNVNVTKAQIEAYLKDKGSDQQKAEYLRLSSPYDDEGNYCGAQPFFTIRDWFLAEFPEFTKAREDRNAQILEINKAIEEKIAKAKKAKAHDQFENYKKNAAERIAA